MNLVDGRLGISTLGYESDGDIAVGDGSDRISIIHDDHRADVVLASIVPRGLRACQARK